MKKLLIMSALCLLAFPASADLNVDLSFGQPTYLEEPAPTYVATPVYPDYYRHRHYHHPRHNEHLRHR